MKTKSPASKKAAGPAPKTTSRKKSGVSKNTTSGTNKKNQPGFPGYPLYPGADDIMNRAERTEADLDSVKGAPKVAPDSSVIDSKTEEEDIRKKGKTGKGVNDLTRDDLNALGADDLEMDDGEDEELRQRTTPVDFAGSDLDVPVDDDDNSAEEAGSEDEENKMYSLGGDDHNDLEEDKS